VNAVSAIDEVAARNVLLDFELIALLALFIGLILYAAGRRVTGRLAEGPEWIAPFDLVLVFFPALMFLINPVIQVLLPAEAVSGEAAAEVETNGDPSGVLVVNLSYFGFVGILTWFLIEWLPGRGVVSVCGLRRLPLSSIVFVSVLGGIGSVLLCGWIIGGVSQGFLREVFDGDLAEQEPVKMFKESTSIAPLILSLLLACVAAPLVEELLFRGYFFPVVAKYTSTFFSMVVTGALFAVVHGNLPALLPLWGFGIILAVAYERTRCLWVPVGIHAVFNAANVLLLFLPSSAGTS